MANFDAMVPLIPRDVRVPVDHERDQLRVNQVEKTKEVEKISDEETNTITEHDSRRQQQQQQQQQQPSQQSSDDEVDNDGHIDTYV
ncbi:hypothetical protein DEU29_11665 [Idiomarina aquatica]|uniref:Uncharacterized protein n=1 Tax=Idiomarina aquatica TaxID=1327752 RepID=A0A4V3CMK3_9GAMM|nr:hypothetical protein [Idiomarina aquatica]TDP29964.1 hypothetical protein DEU29_11665 [Idiomarina aquatica]